MRFQRAFGAMLLVLVVSAPMFAHHSVSGVFDSQKDVEFKGVISRVEWVNPHVYIYVDVKGNDGKVTTWALESYPTLFFSKNGIKRTSFPIGEPVTVTAFTAKDGTKALAFLRQMTFADGHVLRLWAENAVIR